MAKKPTPSDKLNSANLDKVIELLEGSSPITKKAACDILGIAYNTTRLTKLIEEHKETKARNAKMRAEKRGTPASKSELQYIVSSYLEGGSVTNIASSLHRSVAFVHKCLDDYAVPKRTPGNSYYQPSLVPEEAMKDTYKVGEKAYSVQYDSLVRIDGVVPHKTYGKVYRVWVLADKWQQYAYVSSWELASLDKLVEEGLIS
jgi:hypothetical protein